MSWEKRKNKTYYYQKRRHNGRVTSTYIGQGEPAADLLSAQTTVTEKQWRQRNRSRALREQITRLEESFIQLDAFIADLARASLLTAGCHTHKGQWRRKRATPTLQTRHPTPGTHPGTAE